MKVEFYSSSRDILRFREPAFVFVLLLLLFLLLFYLLMGIISIYLFVLLVVLLLIMFYDTYFNHSVEWPVRMIIDESGLKTGFFSYKWSYFRSFSVVKERNKFYFLLRGFLFDNVFPIVIPVSKKYYKKVFKLIRKHLDYEQV